MMHLEDLTIMVDELRCWHLNGSTPTTDTPVGICAIQHSNCVNARLGILTTPALTCMDPTLRDPTIKLYGHLHDLFYQKCVTKLVATV